jgi:hypothetical protein
MACVASVPRSVLKTFHTETTECVVMKSLEPSSAEDTERQWEDHLGFAPWPLGISLCALCVKFFMAND